MVRNCKQCGILIGEMTDEQWAEYQESHEGICDSCAGFPETDYPECDDDYEPGDQPDESMDGDFNSGMASAGLGTNEDYGDYGSWYDDVFDA